MSGSERGMFDPDYCEKRCPVCTRARNGISHRRGKLMNRTLNVFARLVAHVGCLWLAVLAGGISAAAQSVPDGGSKPQWNHTPSIVRMLYRRLIRKGNG